MELLKDFNLNGISFSILKGNKEGFTFRIINKSADFTTTLVDTRYVSKKKGILNLQYTTPFDFGVSPGNSILQDSFIDIFLTFNQGKIEEGDKIELKLQTLAELTLIYHDNQWSVLDSISQYIVKEQLVSQVELLDTAFDKIGISVQNISIEIENDKTFNLFYELTSNDFSPLKDNIQINITIYDIDNHIVEKNGYVYYASEFMGFEVTKRTINVPCSLSQIGRILLYPSIY